MVEARRGGTSENGEDVVGVHVCGGAKSLSTGSEILRPSWVCKPRASSADQAIFKAFHNRDQV